jgi:PB1 domain
MLSRLFKHKMDSTDSAVFKYVDDEGDLVCLESDTDLAHALTLNTIFKVHIYGHSNLSQIQIVPAFLITPSN